ncbi:Uncharacterized conserved protein, Ntn-hydrolase superfamily [Faunimonas pinastri]|uniref:Uncharacterized conserved protein, Ntn-hydrolase superfamily n=1 Tax=Faunimonas pinastri TaxID=1855383 RepID=A0A1H9PK41_9HYPH|nr:DUF1028 domain-containing protein [Faunimonas pinastri]SER48656.1 Uncharacterized conserved protein, Ntn-hydrolase superfamily [Faunimonas pinastri]
MTFSVVARCAETGMFGVAVSSSSPAVAARCAYARAGVGAVASQNVTDPSLGIRALDLLALGADAGQAIEVLRASSRHMEFRQVLAVDAQGSTAIHSGPRALGIWAEARGVDVACGGNLLASPDVPQRMVEAFEASSGPLGDRLIAVMRAALAAGGEAGPVRSAGMKLVDKVSWPVADLRVDWSENCPVEGLAALWQLYKPQLADYVTRAIDPSAAPSYGVPGDE